MLQAHNAVLENDLDDLLHDNCAIFYAWTARGAHTYVTHGIEGDVPVLHYDINRCTFPWNFIVIRDPEACPINPHCGTHVP